MHPNLLDGLNYESKSKDNGRKRSCDTPPSLQHLEGRGACQSFGIGLQRVTSRSIIHIDLYKPNNMLVSAQLEHFWCMDSSRTNIDSQDSPRFGFEGNHHLPPYSIFCAWPRGQHPNVILSKNSQVEVPKFPKLGFLHFEGS